jgi:hypothetical protein
VIPLAFETAAGLATFDLGAGTVVPSVAPGLYDLIYKDRDRSFLSRIRDGDAVPNTEFSWWERTLRPMNVQADADDLDAPGVETALTLVAGHASRIVIGAVLVDESDPTERLQVTDISGAVLTLTRGFGGSTKIAHGASATYRIVALPAQENSTSGLDLLRHPSEVTNYTQILRRDLKASRSSQGVQTYPGYHLNAKRLQEKLEEIRDEMEQFAIFGVPAAATPAGSDTVIRSTGGFLWFVMGQGTPGANVDSAVYAGQTAADLKDKMDAAAKAVQDAGGDANFLLASGDIFGTIMDLDSDKVRFEVTDGVRGSIVTAIRTKYGALLEPVYDRWFPTKYLCVGDYRKNAWRMFSNGGVPHVEELAKTSDGMNFMIIGEGGLQFENAEEANYLYSDVSV